MKKAIKFNSILGYSRTFAKDREKVQIALRVNCKDRTLEYGNAKLISDILDDLAYPEVMSRIRDGNLPSEILISDC